jgi:microsomal dipeptidase-like Zn-dependent dipeptidase
VLRNLLLAAAALVLLAAGFFFLWAASLAGARLNQVDPKAAGEEPRQRARELHAALRIADLHDDLLLWDRDPLEPGKSGHSDLPRLQVGNVAVQVFSTVTWVPRGLNDRSNDSDSDDITWLALASRWPVATWTSRLARALHQADKLERAAAASGGALRLVRSRAELQAALEARAAQPGGRRLVAGLLSTEGLHALDGRDENLDALFGKGYRLAGLAHFFDSEVSGSAHGLAKGGLTPMGKKLVRRMEELGMVVDLAHASPQAIDEVLALAHRPPLVSHTGVQAVCPGPRNLTDAQLRRLAAKGALVGIGYWQSAVCDISPRGIARSVKHAVRVAGAGSVALGSDWDGATTVAFDAAGLSRLTQALLDEGLSEDEVRGVMGENAIRFLLAALP